MTNRYASATWITVLLLATATFTSLATASDASLDVIRHEVARDSAAQYSTTAEASYGPVRQRWDEKRFNRGARAAASGDLIISQYVETNSGYTPKGIELWNATGATIDFSTDNLVVEKYINGNPASSPTTEFTLSAGTLGAGEVLVIGGADLKSYMDTNAPGVDFENDSFSFNGNDALEVTLGGTTTDVFGTIGSDPGTAWTGGGVSTRNSNIQLLSGITSGNPTGFTDPSTRFETAASDPFDLTGFGEAPRGVNAPTVQFAAASKAVSEDDGSTDLTVSITNPDGTAVDVDIVFDTGSSTADVSDIGGYATQTVSFPASASDGATQTVPVTLTDDSELEGDEIASFTLQNLTTTGSTVLGVPSAFGLTIGDNDVGPSGDLIISQYAEDGNIKGIELWNATGAPIDFSSTPLAVERYANGKNTSKTEFSKNTGTLAARDVLVLADGSANTIWSTEGITYEEAPGLNFNGNDAVEIILGGTTTDVLGTIGNDPGDAWTGNGVSTRDQNIQLRPGVVTGDPSGWTDPSTRFETVATAPLDDGTGEDLKGFGTPPATFTELVISGTAGNEGDATSGTLGGDAGWRLIGPPVKGATAADLISISGTNGFDTNDSVIEFTVAQGSMFYRWDDTATGSPPGDWSPINTGSTAFQNGRGYLLFLFDDTGTLDADPLDPDLTLDMATGSVPARDVSVTSLNKDARYHVLANPYNIPYDLTDLVDGNGDRLSSTGSDFQATIQIWDGGPTGSTTTEDGVQAGSYEMDTVNGTPSQNGVGNMVQSGGDLISAWQGFIVERSSPGSGSQQLTFNATGRTWSNRRIVGSKSNAPAPFVRVPLKLTVASADGRQIARDEAASVYLHPGATDGWDAFDASKLTPLTRRYALLGPVGALRDTAAAPAIKAQESRSADVEDVITVPLALQTVGEMRGQATVDIPDWSDIPSAWSLTLIDTQETTDASDDTEQPLTRTSSYTFALDAAAKQGAQTASVMQTTEERQTAGEGQTAGKGARSPFAPPRLDALMLTGADNAAKSDATSPARFTLRIETGGALPVEYGRFDASINERRVALNWKTTSETNNSGFYVEHQRLSPTDSTTTPGAWASLGFVEGAKRNARGQAYRFKTPDLDYGTHAFRLRQVDVDGTTAFSKTLRARVRLDEAVSVNAPYPNPVRQRATLSVTVRNRQTVRIQLYDVLGRRVGTLMDEELPAQETRTLPVDAQRLASGVYFLRIVGDDFATTERMTVVK